WNPVPVRARTIVISAPDFETTIHCRGWALEVESFAEYKKIVRAQLDEKLAIYEGESHAFPSSRFVGAKPEFIKAPRSYDPEHFVWFVLSYFKGMSSLKISKRPGATRTE